MTEPDWVAITKRNARSVQTTIGWIFWAARRRHRPNSQPASRLRY